MNNYVFQGIFSVRLSNQKRIVIPKKFFNVLRVGEKINYVLEKNYGEIDGEKFVYDALLCVPYDIKNEILFMKKVGSNNLTFTNQFSSLDSQHRIRIPKNLLSIIELEILNEGVIIGDKNDYFILYSKKNFDLEGKYVSNLRFSF